MPSDRRRHRQRNAGQPQRQDAADPRQWHVGQDQRRTADVLEGIEQQHEDQQHRQRNHPAQPLHRALLVLELAGPLQPVALRQLHAGVHALAHVGHHAAHVAPGDEEADRLHPLRVLARDVDRAAGHAELGQIGQPAAGHDRHRPGAA
ncbi:hypothetical protein G6F24_016010 [Rhizopus arrhizus]|nr:hypothetical protein G6F24_016010 [Rhizopus arrhizus]